MHLGPRVPVARASRRGRRARAARGLHFLLAAGAPLVQLDEPALSEVVFTGAKNTRGFMCGALSEKGDAESELRFAKRLLDEVTAGLPRERLAMHVCRGNWTPDEGAALAGDYRPLLPLLADVPVGTLFLDLATPRAGELDVLAGLPHTCRVAVGVVNQKREHIESVDEVAGRMRRAIALFAARGRSKMTWDPTLHPDEVNLRWSLLRAIEWGRWPLFLSQPVVPFLLLVLDWKAVVLGTITNLVWASFVRYRFVSVAGAYWGATLVRLKWFARSPPLSGGERLQ